MAKKNGGAALIGVVVALVAFAFYKNPDFLSDLVGGGGDNPPPFAGIGNGNGRYVALGDSYTAAPHVGDSGGGPDGCMRSASDYPSLVARAIRVRQFVDASCSGARTTDLFSTQGLDGQNNAPQLDALNSATTLVTLGIGGNDIGYIELVRGCISATPNGSRCRDNDHGRTAARIDNAAAGVSRALSTIHAKAPHARVLVVGYPTILPAHGRGCWPVVPYGAPDVAYLRGIEAKLNRMLASEAGAHGASFVDTASASVGHDVCTGISTRWVEGLVPTSAAAPMHPNAKGAHASARAVLRTLR